MNKANEFINTLSENLGIEDKEKVYRMFKSVLHTLRDSITLENSLHFLAQLPFILKATYVDNWSHKVKRIKIKHTEDFVKLVKRNDGKAFDYDFLSDGEVERICKIIFSTIGDFISEGEMNNLKSVLPSEIKQLFDSEPVLL
ncbi:MAG: DUF2267 domain-containing protein [Bacteroidetes bacterium]|nr:DUF2267 domain-containing protein [Bacteroidota bacterium]